MQRLITAKTEPSGKFTFKLLPNNGRNSGALGFKVSHASLDTVLFETVTILSPVS